MEIIKVKAKNRKMLKGNGNFKFLIWGLIVISTIYISSVLEARKSDMEDSTLFFMTPFNINGERHAFKAK
jgi:hypothetical protein